MSRWYRAYEGTVTDAKLGEVALVAGCSRSVAIAAWHCILESCAATNDAGKFDTTPRRVAVILGEPLSVIEAVFAEMTALGMLSSGSVTAWSSRQFESDSSTERSRRRREALRNGDATLQQRDATTPERDATPPYTDTEEEGKKKTSFSQKTEKASGSKRGERLAPDWRPSASGREHAISIGVPGHLIDREAERFRDYWIAKPGKDGAKLDWEATWRNWIRKLADDKGFAPFQSPISTGPPIPKPPRDGLPSHEELLAKYSRPNNATVPANRPERSGEGVFQDGGRPHPEGESGGDNFVHGASQGRSGMVSLGSVLPRPFAVDAGLDEDGGERNDPVNDSPVQVAGMAR